MAGTKAGGMKAAATNKIKHGEDFYAKIGKKGGSVSTPEGGFGSKKIGPDGLTGAERAKIVGARGGRNGHRGPAKPKVNADGSKNIEVKKVYKPAVEIPVRQTIDLDNVKVDVQEKSEPMEIRKGLFARIFRSR